MYIDRAIIEELEDEFSIFMTKKIIHAVIDNTPWLSFEDVKQEWNKDYTLEEVFDKYYFIVEENKILFCSPDWFWSSVQEIQQEMK